MPKLLAITMHFGNIVSSLSKWKLLNQSYCRYYSFVCYIFFSLLIHESPRYCRCNCSDLVSLIRRSVHHNSSQEASDFRCIKSSHSEESSLDVRCSARPTSIRLHLLPYVGSLRVFSDCFRLYEHGSIASELRPSTSGAIANSELFPMLSQQTSAEWTDGFHVPRTFSCDDSDPRDSVE